MSRVRQLGRHNKKRIIFLSSPLQYLTEIQYWGIWGQPWKPTISAVSTNFLHSEAHPKKNLMQYWLFQCVWAAASQRQVACRGCGRTFSRQGDLKRHECLLERSKPVEEQRGSVQCTMCSRRFRSDGGLSVHKRRLHGVESWSSLLP